MIFMFPISNVWATGADKKTVTGVSYEHILSWAMGLVIVLALFFVCVWFMRKMGVVSAINTKQQMRVLTGLSLGMREKLVLVQVGEKQLVLGVTPGRIDNLLVLEGDDLLYKEIDNQQGGDNFSEKLKQLMTGAAND
ncbi:MAG: flagellar biosynthetic protein FliO [Methylococcales bacterium]|nr:flagellar biosynthetic protein FliO [Methylococcales bacterium]